MTDAERIEKLERDLEELRREHQEVKTAVIKFLRTMQDIESSVEEGVVSLQDIEESLL